VKELRGPEQALSTQEGIKQMKNYDKRIIEYIGEKDEPVGLGELRKHFDMPGSYMFDDLNHLIQQGQIAWSKDVPGHYVLAEDEQK
jgi:hypothetical protein